MLHVRDHLAQQLGDVIVIELVHDLTAVTPAGHQAEVPEQPELMGDRGALHPDRLGEDVDRRRPGVQAGEDPQPARGRQRLDAVRGGAREVLVVEQPGDVVVIGTVRHRSHHDS